MYFSLFSSSTEIPSAMLPGVEVNVSFPCRLYLYVIEQMMEWWYQSAEERMSAPTVYPPPPPPPSPKVRVALKIKFHFPFLYFVPFVFKYSLSVSLCSLSFGVVVQILQLIAILV